MTRGLARHLSRTKPHRNALMKNLCSQLLQHGTINSTTPKLKEAQRYVERVITIAKNGVRSGNREACVPELQSRLFLSGDNSRLLKKLFDEIVPRYMERDGGYTRVLKLEPRLGDRAPQSILELVDSPVQNSEGQLLRGNMKLWLLTKSYMEAGDNISELTIKNLKKMTKYKPLEELVADMGVIRKYILDADDKEFDQAAHDEFLSRAVEILQNYSPSEPKEKGYFFTERPAQH